MAQHKVADHADLRKDDRGFVVNTNNDEYEKALKRQKKAKDDEILRDRVANLEGKMDQILDLLTNLNNRHT